MAKEQTATKRTATTTNAVMALSKNGNPIIQRERIVDKNGQPMKSRDGNPMYSYCLHGTVRGNRKVKVEFAPRDIGGYEPLDILFDGADTGELYVHDVTTEINGTKSTRTVYTAFTISETGVRYECDVRPQRDSDKAKLQMLFAELKAQNTAAA